MSVHRATLAAAAVIVASHAVAQAGDVPEPSPLVVNPRAEVWNGFEPGAWARHEGAWVEPEAARAAGKWESVSVLAETNADELVVWDGSRVAGTKDAYTGSFAVIDRKISADEIKRAWTASPVLALRNLVGPVIGTEKIAETKETLTVAGQTLICRVLDVSVPAEDAGPLRRTRLWLSGVVPGGVVREETELQSMGGRIRKRSTLSAFGRKPDGSFRLPPTWDPEQRRHESPTYARWAAFPPLSVTTFTEEFRSARVKDTRTVTLILMEVRPTHLVLGERSQVQRTTGGSSTPGSVEYDAPNDAVLSIRRRAQLPYFGKVSDEGFTTPSGFKSTETRGKETLKVRSEQFECTTVETVATGEDASLRLRTKEWLHPQIPGQLVKWEREESQGPDRFLQTRLLTHWSVPAK
jgi:hypothetical protein